EGSLGLEGPCGEPRDSARGSDPESIGGKVPTRRSARMEGPGLRTPNSTAALRDPPPRGREALPPDFLAVAQTASPPVVAHGRRFVSLETSSLEGLDPGEGRSADRLRQVRAALSSRLRAPRHPDPTAQGPAAFQTADRYP